MNFTSTSEIKARVYELYLTEDQEVNSNFFDFHVRNLRSTLLKTYAEIQKAINGNGLYDGNYKEFLEEYNGKENLTGLYRLMDPVYTDSKSITGVKLDFI